MFDSIGVTEALLDGDIDEVENPDNGSGVSLFRLVMFKATDLKVCRKTKVETDKPKMIPMAWISLAVMCTWDGQ